MRVFVYEYTCAAAGALPPSLRAEGQAMLTAVLGDLNRVPGVETVTLQSAGDDPAAFRELARVADCTLVIAPELNGLLVDRCRRVLEAGGHLLGPLPGAVRATADKQALARLWSRHGVPIPRCSRAEGKAPATVRFPAVLKPRFGAGSQATCLVRSLEDLPACLAATAPEAPAGGMLLQTFVAGMPASVAFLLGPRQAIPLVPATQHLSDDGRFRYLGGTLPLPPPLAQRAVKLGLRAVQAVAGLRGYVGVDLVLGAADDGGDDRAIEINPRLTTSYIGLRVLAVDNLAEILLRVVYGEPVAVPVWRPGAVHFAPVGGP